jgi:hypothetical protein
MPATLKLTRETAFAFELHRRPFDIEVDSKTTGSIKSHETVETPIEPGHHTLRLRSGRYSSRRHSFDVTDGDVASFRCHGTVIWPTFAVSLLVPNLAISVKPLSA